METFNPELLDKEKIIVVSKTDLCNEEALTKIKKRLPKDVKTIMISAHAQKGLVELKDILWATLNQ